MATKRHKILFISDHQTSPSGVGTQSLALISGLIDTGKYSFKCLGGAIRHPSMQTAVVNPHFVIKPVEGFGTKEQLREILITERPDAILIFTDPRQFIWLWEMEDEIKQICPLAYWHIWDNGPYPDFNKPWYDSTELINCISWKTYELVKPRYPDKTNFIPHAFPKDVVFPLSKEEIKNHRQQTLGNKADWFVALWVNRNATRKMPGDVIYAWKLFLDELEKKEGHRKAVLVMHTDPNDIEGPNLMAISDSLQLGENLVFSQQKLNSQDMNVLYNMSDTVINISKAEGWGLSITHAMQIGKPVIALKTGGMTWQVIDHRNGREFGVALEPKVKTMVGSQMVPYILEDFTTHEDVRDAYMKIYSMSPEEREEIGKAAMEYVGSEMNYTNIISKWDETLEKCIQDFKQKKTKQWELVPLFDEVAQNTKQTIPATHGRKPKAIK